MNVILVSDRLAKARSINLTHNHLWLLFTSSLFAFVGAVLTVQYLLIRFDSGLVGKELRGWLASAQQDRLQKEQAYLRERLDTMAQRMGQIEAQLGRIDALGVRLAKLAGMKPQEFSFDHPPALGGPYIPLTQPEIGMDSMLRQIVGLAERVQDRNDKLEALETMLLQDRLSRDMLPTMAPIDNGWYSSNFGWRIDPFTGHNAMHEGVDYMVPEGTPIRAAAGGMVVFADYHPQYGNMVEIDHGNEIITRYAHASRLLVKVGDVVRRGQLIARVGSTGRSTGNHLHFEIRYQGIAQNPTRFLQNSAG